MGCCGNSNVDNNDIKTNDFNSKYANLRQGDKVQQIIKIQATYRGHLTRKRIAEFRGEAGFPGYDGNP